MSLIILSWQTRPTYESSLLDSSVHLSYVLLRLLEFWGKNKGNVYVRKRARRKARKKGRQLPYFPVCSEADCVCSDIEIINVEDVGVRGEVNFREELSEDSGIRLRREVEDLAIRHDVARALRERPRQ